MAVAAFNEGGAGGLPSIRFTGTEQSAATPNANLLYCVTNTTLGETQIRRLRQPMPRIGGALSQSFGLATVPIRMQADIKATISGMAAFLAQLRQYRVGGRYTLSDEFGRSWSYVELGTISGDAQPTAKITGVAAYAWRLELGFEWMQPA
ncbi:MAG: hypothetical protein SF069_02955 [Phycisphaerae bacterium]|nr:hypothetical protein [Phycisphaerae bacterium]